MFLLRSLDSLASLVLCCLLLGRRTESACPSWTPASQAQTQSLFLHFASGRFSARLTPYVIFLILREKHHMNVMVDRECFNSVSKFFSLSPGSQLPVFEEEFCEGDQERIKRHMIDYSNKGQNIMEEHFLELQSKGIVVNMWPEGPPSKSTYWVPEDLMNNHAAFIRRQLTFHEGYQRFADNILGQLSASHTGPAPPLYVGLHVRRTDYVHFSKVYLNKRVAGKSYFLEAIEYYQEEYPHHSVYFLAVSDDLAWVKKNLGSIKGVVVAGSAEAEADLRSGLDPVGCDLALLASCNHTIMSQGQYGLWGAFLAGGDVYSQYGPLMISTRGQ